MSRPLHPEALEQQTVHAIFEVKVAEYPHHMAITDGEKIITYAELNQRANQLAHHLLTFHLPQETLIAVSLERSTEFVIAVLAVLKAGHVFVPLDYTHPPERLHRVWEDNQTPLLITSMTSHAHFAAYKGQRIYMDVDREKINLLSTENPLVPVKPNAAAYVIYTSGSTGQPKGVMIEHRSLLNHVQWFQQYTECQVTDTIDFSANYIFDMAMTSYLVALLSGMHVVICSDEIKKDIREYLHFLSKHQINFSKMTPSFFKILLQQSLNSKTDLSHTKAIILGGENLPAKDCAAWLELYPHHSLFNEYGPTEAAIAVLVQEVTIENVQQFSTFVPIGKPNAEFNIACYVLDKQNHLVAGERIGELHIGGINLAREYLHQELLTKEKFIEHPLYSRLYKTGDVCRYLPDGTIEYIGRMDDQVKIRGFRVELSEIECILTDHPEVLDAIVIARSIEEDKQLIAYFRTHSATAIPSAASLRQHLEMLLPDYMVPQAFVWMEMYPLTANGKLDKKALPQPQFVFSKNQVLPYTELQEKITAIWREVLNIQVIGVHDHFFELGGHSLAAARIISRIEQALGKIISLKDFYAYPTIFELTEHLEQVEAQATQEIAIHPDETTDALSDFQFMFWISNIFEPKVKKINIIARRRIAGRLDQEALTQAFGALFEKHRILSYKIAKFSPKQQFKPHLNFSLLQEDLTNLSLLEKEKALSRSLNQLINESNWKESAPALIAKLFYLENDVSELQICMPHIFSDDASEEILFNDLSMFYEAYTHHKTIHGLENLQYQYFVLHEHRYLKQLDQDIVFWEDYLKDAALLQFPLEMIDKNCKSYSTYLDVPERVLQNIQRLSQHHQISFVDLLCASIVLGLKKTINDTTDVMNQKILLSIIKSVREKEIFENMLGCFIRLDPVKVDMRHQLPLVELAKEIRASMLDIAKHQHCSSMVKLACMTKTYWKKHKAFDLLLKTIAVIYSKLFSKLKLSAKILHRYARLKALRTPHHFLINLNLFHNFIEDPRHKKQRLFNFETINLNIFRYDLSTIDNVLDICFLRDDARDKTYLVVSSNLKPAVRETLGKSMLEVLAK